MAPARVAGATVRQIPEDQAEAVLLRENTSDVFPWSLDGDYGTYPLHRGPAVWTRPCPARAVHAEALRQQGFRQVGEIDDNYLADGKHNVFLRSSGQNEDTRRISLKALAAMDAMVFTTVALRDMYWKAFKNYKFPMPELHVCGNHLFVEDWPEVVPSDGPLRVGWMGSSSHVWDVDIAWASLLFASRNGCKTYMIGYDPANPETDVTSPRAIEKREQWRKVGHEFVPWRKMSGTERLSLPLDIGLCPLRWDEFTAGKSDIKAVEYTISGAAVVASNHPVYSRNWVHGETALLCGSDREMIDAVERLMRDENLRSRLVENARQYVREERNIEKHVDEWRAAIYG